MQSAISSPFTAGLKNLVFRSLVIGLALLAAGCVSNPRVKNVALAAGTERDDGCKKIQAAAKGSQRAGLLDGSWAPCVPYRPGWVTTPPGKNEHSEDVLVLVAVSGGGKRSAAFSYGAFDVLLNDPEAAFQLTDRVQRSILGEADIISAVSGGALTASYFALYREAMFDQSLSTACTYKSFLLEDTGAEIWKLYLAPWKWGWLMSDRYGSNDVMASFYADRLFGGKGRDDCFNALAPAGAGPTGATFGDLYLKGPPILLLEATDVTQAMTFPYYQDTFDQLCSDITNYPLAWAVAASNGFPVVLSTIALENFHFSKRKGRSTDCRPKGNTWLYDERGDKKDGVFAQFESIGCDRDRLFERDGELTQSELPKTFFRNELLKTVAACRLSPGASQYVHAADGGLMDNLALQGITDWLQTHTDLTDVPFWSVVLKTKRVELLIVDGQSAKSAEVAKKESGPDLWASLDSMISTTVEQGNLNSFGQAQESVSLLVRLMVLRDIAAIEQIFNDGKVMTAESFTKLLTEIDAARTYDKTIDAFIASEMNNYNLSTTPVTLKRSQARDKIRDYFILSEQGSHSTLPIDLKGRWNDYLELQKKTRAIALRNHNKNIAVEQVMRLSIDDDCDSNRRSRLLNGDTGLGLERGIILDAIESGKDVTRRHLAKIREFMATGSDRTLKPACSDWLGKASIEQGVPAVEPTGQRGITK